VNNFLREVVDICHSGCEAPIRVPNTTAAPFRARIMNGICLAVPSFRGEEGKFLSLKEGDGGFSARSAEVFDGKLLPEWTGQPANSAEPVRSQGPESS
jgi:hypothetical protein